MKATSLVFLALLGGKRLLIMSYIYNIKKKREREKGYMCVYMGRVDYVPLFARASAMLHDVHVNYLCVCVCRG